MADDTRITDEERAEWRAALAGISGSKFEFTISDEVSAEYVKAACHAMPRLLTAEAAAIAALAKLVEASTHCHDCLVSIDPEPARHCWDHNAPNEGEDERATWLRDAVDEARALLARLGAK